MIERPAGAVEDSKKTRKSNGRGRYCSEGYCCTLGNDSKIKDRGIEFYTKQGHIEESKAAGRDVAIADDRSD